MPKLNHFNQSGDVHMVDVGDKEITLRQAITEGRIYMQPDTLKMIVEGKHKKGDVLGIARTAGIMAAKKTSDLIPLCHPISITHVDISLEPVTDENIVICTTTVETRGQTGVEMEALTATQITLLTIYDMCKAVDRGMVISDVCLLQKSGGKSGLWEKPGERNARKKD